MKPNPIRLARNLNSLRQHLQKFKENGKTIGFVPTMGALHDGHMSLVEIAKANADIAVASIFVNPTQFAPGEDFEAYPRTEEEDLRKLEAAGCALAYIPRPQDMYPEGTRTTVRVEHMSDLLDGRHRPHFFYGVATVVARLFVHVAPDVAVFGEKDYQQLQIIKRMTKDLGFATEIIGGPTWRDPDGLAQSSRNAYLSREHRRAAGAIQAALHRASVRLSLGAPVGDALEEATMHILRAGFDEVDYVEAVHAETVESVAPDAPAPDHPVRLLAAARIGGTRLIDNIQMRAPGA